MVWMNNPPTTQYQQQTSQTAECTSTPINEIKSSAKDRGRESASSNNKALIHTKHERSRTGVTHTSQWESKRKVGQVAVIEKTVKIGR